MRWRTRIHWIIFVVYGLPVALIWPSRLNWSAISASTKRDASSRTRSTIAAGYRTASARLGGSSTRWSVQAPVHGELQILEHFWGFREAVIRSVAGSNPA